MLRALACLFLGVLRFVRKGYATVQVDDMDDDGPLVKLRWLYRPDEIPTSCLKVRADSHDQVVRCDFFNVLFVNTDLPVCDLGDGLRHRQGLRSAGGECLAACYRQEGNSSQCPIIR